MSSKIVRRGALVSALTFAFVASLWGFTEPAATGVTKSRADFLDSVRRGVVRGVPKGNKSAARVEALEAFVAARAGVRTSKPASDKLRTLEASYLAGSGGSVTSDELASAVTAWIVDDVLGTLGEGETSAAIAAGRGFDAEDLPESFRQGRTQVHITITEPPLELSPLEVEQIVEACRASDGARETMRAYLEPLVAARIAATTEYLNEAEPERFRRDGMSPVDAILVVYSAVTGDLMCGSQAELRADMQALHDGIERGLKTTYPNPEGRLPYGSNGYLVSSPSTVVFTRLEALIDRLAV